jgi:hypothetical protein
VVERSPPIEIDAALVAPRLGLALAEFRQLMEQRRITVLCEMGVGEDAGRYRASFYYGDRRVRLVVDAAGRVCDRISGA